MVMKKNYILLFIGLVIIIAISIPVFALDGKSNYEQKISGNSVYFSVGNVGNVLEDTDITIPINVGGANYAASGITLRITYNNDKFDFLSIELGDDLSCDGYDPTSILPSIDDVENLGYVSVTLLCNQGQITSHGNLLNLELHTTSDFNLKETINISVDDFYYLPSHTQIKKDLTYITYDGTVSLSNVYHKVTFADWNGLVLDTQLVGDGASPIDIPHPHRKGYIFTNWSDELLNLNSDSLLIAQYDVLGYTVGFKFINEDEGWDNEPITQIVEYGKPAIEPDSPSGYVCNFNDVYTDYSFVDKDMTIIVNCEAIEP